ncbi:hypothetical protein L6452_43802 [Arctium lappa]|uniref:Uncharacterized protein n=1 Tax=Arctium lappa TaxID=4217 RepID=A0ACB8XEA5_ARCLA|nr:hypothetical protein L6452_43802 [Arctium lappa]
MFIRCFSLAGNYSKIDSIRVIESYAFVYHWLKFSLDNHVFVEDIVNLIVESGVVPLLVQHLQEPQLSKEAVTGLRLYEHEVEKGSAFTLGLLAIKFGILDIIQDE